MTTRALHPDTVRDKLKAFICGALLGRPDYPLEADEPLMSGGLIDSFCVTHIGVFIERQFHVYIADTELTVEGMDTLQQIVARVLRG